MKPKRELIRILRVTERTETSNADPSATSDPPRIIIDNSGKANGRGAYVCPDAACVARVRKNGAVKRMLGVEPPADVWSLLERQVAG